MNMASLIRQTRVEAQVDTKKWNIVEWPLTKSFTVVYLRLPIEKLPV